MESSKFNSFGVVTTSCCCWDCCRPFCVGCCCCCSPNHSSKFNENSARSMHSFRWRLSTIMKEEKGKILKFYRKKISSSYSLELCVGGSFNDMLREFEHDNACWCTHNGILYGKFWFHYVFLESVPLKVQCKMCNLIWHKILTMEIENECIRAPFVLQNL